MAEEEQQSSGYNKRPLWQWILIYIVIGGIIYGLIYYVVLSKKSGNMYNQQTQQYPVSPTAMQSKAVSSDTIYMTKTDTAKGKYLTDFQGMTLYIFDKDTQGVSNCYNDCAKKWPPYSSGATVQAQLPQYISVIKRTDGSTQYAWKGMPLYYYASDQKVGDITGDGVGGVWHIINL